MKKELKSITLQETKEYIRTTLYDSEISAKLDGNLEIMIEAEIKDGIGKGLKFVNDDIKIEIDMLPDEIKNDLYSLYKKIQKLI